MRESLPLARIQEAVLEFLRERDDAILFGAQAVNAYVNEPRMTQDIDLLSIRAAHLAEELREHLSVKFHIAIRVSEVAGGKGFRVYQIRKEGNRHLVDVRAVERLPATQRIGDVSILMPAELIASKVVSYAARRGKPKAGTDWRDVAMLLLKFPELKTESGAVTDNLKAIGNNEDLAVWRELVKQEIIAANEDEDLDY